MPRTRKKESEKVLIVVGVPLRKRTVEALDAEAQADDRSRAHMARKLIEQGLETRRPAKAGSAA